MVKNFGINKESNVKNHIKSTFWYMQLTAPVRGQYPLESSTQKGPSTDEGLLATTVAASLWHQRERMRLEGIRFVATSKVFNQELGYL